MHNQIFCLMNMHLIWEKERDFSVWANFNDFIWPISKHLDFRIFKQQFFAPGKIYQLFLLSTEEDKSLSSKITNGRIVLQHDEQHQGSVEPGRYL